MHSRTVYASGFLHACPSVTFHPILLRSTLLVYKPIRRGLFSLTWSLRSYTSFALFHQVTTLKLLVITAPLWIITSKPWPPRPHPDPIWLLYSLKLDSNIRSGSQIADLFKSRRQTNIWHSGSYTQKQWSTTPWSKTHRKWKLLRTSLTWKQLSYRA